MIDETAPVADDTAGDGAADEEYPRTPFREWPAAGRWVVWGAIGLVVVLLATYAGAAAVVRRSFPRTDATIGLTRLVERADIRRDTHGVPYVSAPDARDLFLAQGYAQAQDQFFAMDVARHRAAGRLAELLGRSAVPSDLTARTLGWQRLAEAEYPMLAPTTQSYLRAFSAGVNAYLAAHTPSRLALQYTVLELGGLNYKPERWEPVDSLAILQAQAGWRDDVATEVERARLAVDRTPAQVDELYPAATSRLTGADAFAVAGSRTASGRPLLADAPAVRPSAPSPWIQVGLRCTRVTPVCPFSVSGATWAGVPGVVAGHNGGAAWGLAAGDSDVADLFLEKVQGDEYLRGRQWLPLARRDEVIRIAGEPSRKFTVRATEAGPLLSDVSGEVSSVGANAPVPAGAPERGNGYAVALAATALAPARSADALFALDAAADTDGVLRAAASFALPGHDLVVADDGDRIGRVALGPLPRRATGADGADAEPAWVRGNRWFGTLTELPTTRDPVGGTIGGNDRVRTLLAVPPTGGWTAESLARVQADTRNPLAPDLVPLLLRVLLPSRYYADGQRLLAGWDYSQPAGSAAAAYFNVVWSNLLRLTFHDQLRPSLWPDGGARWMVVVRKLLAEPNSPWWDDVDTAGIVEDRDTILGEAMRDARDELTRTVARDTTGWAWGDLLRVHLRDGPLRPRDLGPLNRIFDRGPSPVGGGPATIAGTEPDLALGYDVVRAPGLRFVADLGDRDASRWVGMAGASGHAFADHHVDQSPVWRAGESLAWPFTPVAVRRSGDDVVRLRRAD
ncbi:penicillin acylase family protein [Marmoricola sp. RAF53]|uniref:penicillin acylase family protein n=1 Tax=Marmoricola sp. RAF53 TaxID=3233059 RepID=UPI003F9C4301